MMAAMTEVSVGVYIVILCLIIDKDDYIIVLFITCEVEHFTFWTIALMLIQLVYSTLLCLLFSTIPLSILIVIISFSLYI